MSLHRNAAASLGILMLETRFPRLLGDIGNPASFDFPVRYAVVRGASPARAVRERDLSLLHPFIDAGRELVAQGAAAIATSCGFLALFQPALSAALPVPVWTSSLLLLPELPRAGVITIDGVALGSEHLHAVGADPRTPIEGIDQGSSFQRSVLDNLPTLDAEDASRQVVAAARRLVARHRRLTDIVLECTNMPPYAEAVRRATGRRVHDITTLVARRWPVLPR